MKDIAGHPLALGDTVAYALTGYREMALGTITRFTPKGMKVMPLNPRHDWDLETFRAPQMVCRTVKA